MQLTTKSIKRRELEQIADSLRSELTMQAEQHLNHYVQEEQVYFTFHLRHAKLHLQPSNTKLHLQYEYWMKTSEIEARMTASDNAYAQVQSELLEKQSQPQEHQKELLAGGHQLRGKYNEHVGQLRRKLQETLHQRQLDSESGTASRQSTQREKTIHQRNLTEQAKQWRVNAMEIFDEGRAAVNAERQKLSAERAIVIQLQEHFAETQIQVDD